MQKKTWFEKLQYAKDQFVHSLTSRGEDYVPKKPATLYMPKGYTDHCMVNDCKKTFGYTGQRWHCGKRFSVFVFYHRTLFFSLLNFFSAENFAFLYVMLYAGRSFLFSLINLGCYVGVGQFLMLFTFVKKAYFE
jgi:hypothetical protein